MKFYWIHILKSSQPVGLHVIFFTSITLQMEFMDLFEGSNEEPEKYHIGRLCSLFYMFLSEVFSLVSTGWALFHC